jgi:hypothetical protein
MAHSVGSRVAEKQIRSSASISRRRECQIARGSAIEIWSPFECEVGRNNSKAKGAHQTYECASRPLSSEPDTTRPPATSRSDRWCQRFASLSLTVKNEDERSATAASGGPALPCRSARGVGASAAGPRSCGGDGAGLTPRSVAAMALLEPII